jgi:hypothetical protein
MPSIDYEKKFRDSGLVSADEQGLFNKIICSKDAGELLSLIYIYGRSFPKKEKIADLCEYYLGHPIPGLTAVCMRVLIEYWGELEGNINIISKYLDTNLYDIWYDEVIFSVSFVGRHLENPNFDEKIKARYFEVKADSSIDL